MGGVDVGHRVGAAGAGAYWVACALVLVVSLQRVGVVLSDDGGLVPVAERCGSDSDCCAVAPVGVSFQQVSNDLRIGVRLSLGQLDDVIVPGCGELSWWFRGEHYGDTRCSCHQNYRGQRCEAWSRDL